MQQRVFSGGGGLELVPHAEFVDVANAHHMVSGDDNDAFGAAVIEFLDRVVAGR